MKSQIAIPLMIVLLSATLAGAQEPATLKVGDPAPPLLGRRWVKGEPIRNFERGKIYVIEMWATWCVPNAAVIPYLNRIQQEFGPEGVVVIGQNIWEDNPGLIGEYLRQSQNPMAYRVVMDDVSAGDRGKMAAAWMKAAGQAALPVAFVVNRQGDLAWVGHPLSLEPVLRQMIARTFDAQKAAEQQAELTRLENEIQTAMNGRQWDRALELLNDLEKAQPAGPLRDRVAIVRFHLLLQNGSYDDAYVLGRELMERFKQDFSALNEMSWTILDEPGLGTRDLDLAERMAIRAVELSRREDASILDTLARAQFEKGNLDEAIDLQTEAMSKAPEGLKRMFQVPLERYRQAKATGKRGSNAGDK